MGGGGGGGLEAEEQSNWALVGRFSTTTEMPPVKTRLWTEEDMVRSSSRCSSGSEKK